ncbi:MAG: type II toxin-antitoxin system MqsR family toxin [Candidatus Pseudomonas phytovorans]|uniref:Type II toxin-antitoxin system MqsR family toxin n=1 Tax=Candidatus Pseudomonas phytovorans TaxID=3121377 RepID=A0AAJ5WMM8_9PSED|nr:type II toxin-antitoxin system MqsR family toxin [Pseudomonas sp.]WEK32639.1 MAG: type II toxin-antitoxin system MqsR family toxin [Pseudomonas sp.]
MEKRTPHCPLDRLQTLLSQGKVRTTQAAALGARSLGLRPYDMLDVVRRLSPRDFHKSMTSYHDHRVWQDVYRAQTAGGRAYLKLTVIDDLLIVSFKEL